MEDLKMIIAGNIGKLRREAGITQTDLAETLNYSDKAVSKWERGESLPDVVTLKRLADHFNVSLDYLVRADHPKESELKQEYTKRQQRNHFLITVMSCMLIWLIAAFLYAGVDAVAPVELSRAWMTFVYAVPATAIVLLIFNSIWGNARRNFVIISILVWSFLACIYLTALVFFSANQPLMFIIGIPAQIIVGLWSGLRFK